MNLYLEVLRRRDDGYHDIETIFQPVSLYDEVTLAPRSSGISLTGNDPSIPWNETNLCHRAAAAIFEAAGHAGGIAIDVRKEIPAGSGLGGGSSNAAATLVGLNELLSFRFPEERLRALALRIGSDVPFFVVGRPAVGRGRGELLEETEGLSVGYIVIVMPPITVSTARAYSRLNLGLTRIRRGTTLQMVLEGLRTFPNRQLDTYNSFESGVIEEFSEIGDILMTCKRRGAFLCSLSGSGAACFAVFHERDRAEEVQRHFTAMGLFARLTRPVNRAMILRREE